MPTYNDEGIVLRRVDYGETDRILTVMTREHGKLGVIARGVRKPKSRSAGHTDLFTRSRMQLAQGRGELLVLAQASAIPPVVMCSDPIRLACAGACAELIDRVLENAHPDERTFQLLSESILECVSGDRDPRAELIWFVQRLLQHLGYAPQLHNCANCEHPLSEQAASFVARVGGLVCSTCTASTAGRILCGVRAIKVLRVIQAGDRETFVRLKMDAALVRDLEGVVEAELAEHLSKRLRALDMLRSLVPSPRG